MSKISPLLIIIFASFPTSIEPVLSSMPNILAVFNVISEIYLSALTRGYEDALELFQEKIDEQKESISNRN